MTAYRDQFRSRSRLAAAISEHTQDLDEAFGKSAALSVGGTTIRAIYKVALSSELSVTSGQTGVGLPTVPPELGIWVLLITVVIRGK